MSQTIVIRSGASISSTPPSSKCSKSSGAIVSSSGVSWGAFLEFAFIACLIAFFFAFASALWSFVAKYSRTFNLTTLKGGTVPE